MRRARGVLVVLAGWAVLAGPALAAPGDTTRVSVDSAGGDANGHSFAPAISGDGRSVAFLSLASDLVAGDSNGAMDLFVRDRSAGSTEPVTVESAGTDAMFGSDFPAISANGRFVAFLSLASDLVAGDTNDVEDVFVHDRQAGTIERVSVDSAGGQANSESGVATISGDGRFVAFPSAATNLVAGDTNGQFDVFVRDRQSGSTERVSLDSAGAQGNAASGGGAISGDGRFVAFGSAATNLVAGDTNGAGDVFVRDRQTGTTERVSLDSAGGQGNAGSGGFLDISGDGRFVVFTSPASNLVAGDTNGTTDVFVRDRQTGTTERVSVDSAGTQGNFASLAPAISGDGRFVAFHSFSSNLVAGDSNGTSDVFVRDRQTGTTERVSVNSAGAQADAGGEFPAISGDGRFVAFQSPASNLVAGDTNGFDDVFVHDRGLAGPSDTTAPQITIRTPPDGAVYPRGAVVLADYECSDEPGGSGLASCSGPVPDGVRLDTATLGAKTFTVTARDNARNERSLTHRYTVVDDTPPPPHCDGQPATIVVPPQSGPVSGTPGADVIVGSASGDVIRGLGGDDRICGGGGDDQLSGGGGNDRLFGGGGDDRLSGGSGDDAAAGGGGEDRLGGGAGSDELGGGGADDRLRGGAGSDELRGGGGNDQLFGDSGNDTLAGGNGRDRLQGDRGNDELSGGRGNDRLFGGDGDDDLDGGPGRDLCRGGPDADSARNCEI